MFDERFVRMRTHRNNIAATDALNNLTDVVTPVHRKAPVGGAVRI